jgi:virginiamycin B lyase
MLSSILALVFTWANVVLAQGSSNKSNPATFATVLGDVVASAPFKAAQVYLRNTDRNVLYMVYTSAGHYRAVYLLPGDYELSAKAKGQVSKVQKLTLKVGTNTAPELSMQESETAKVRGADVVTFNEMYPPGPGRDLARATCIGCHGPNFLPGKQWTAEQWSDAVNMMNEIGTVSFSDESRKSVVDWLVANFGPDSSPRTLKWDMDLPVDESALSKAMYIEYYPHPEPGKENTRGHGRHGQDPHFDEQGNVWFTDRGIPNRLCKLDPRTGEIREWTMPNPRNDVHGLTIDSKGVIWTEELKNNPHLVAFDPRTEKFSTWEFDPKHQLGNSVSGDTPILDEHENVWVSLIYGDALAKWDRKTQEITLYRTPSRHAFPYGMDTDSAGNIWTAEFVAGKVARLDPRSGKWSEYSALNQPVIIRRMSVDSKGIVWYAVYSAGKLGRLDPATGEVKEFTIPVEFSQPYDVWPDYQNNLWISDNGQGGTLIKYQKSSGAFTFYPTPQLTDQPKLDITRDGAIWYCPRTAPDSGVGVLYPDMTKIRELGAYYAHGIENGSKYLGSQEAQLKTDHAGQR